MAELLTNVAIADGYTPGATLGPSLGITQLVFQVFNEPVYAQFFKPPAPDPSDPTAPQRQPTLDPTEHYFPVGTLLSVDGAGGARFRNAIAGQPATINAQIAFTGDPLFDFQSSGLFSAAVLTLSFLHNNSLVGAEAALDFEDSTSIVWTVTDTPGTKEAVSAAPAFGAVTAGAFVFSDPISTGPTSNAFTGTQTAGVFVNIPGSASSLTFFGSVAFDWLQAGRTADTVRRFSINDSGLMQWGAGGAAAQDSTLQRIGAGRLQLGTATQDGRLDHSMTAAANIAIAVFVTGDTNTRLLAIGDGTLKWGTGAAAPDVNVSRGAVGLLLVGTGASASTGGQISNGPLSNAVGGAATGALLDAAGRFISISGVATQTACNFGIPADTQWRFTIDHNGTLAYSAGSGSFDVTAARTSAGGFSFTSASTNVFTTGSMIAAMGGDGASPLFNAIGSATGAALNGGGVLQVSRATGNAVLTVTNPGATTDWRFSMLDTGLMKWAAANTAADVQLSRVNPGQLAIGGTGGGNLITAGTTTAINSTSTFTPDAAIEWNGTTSLTLLANITITVANPIHPPTTSQTATIYLKFRNSSGSFVVTLSWGAAYRSTGSITLPGSVPVSTQTVLQFQWDPDQSVWQLIAKIQ